ncbi:MAG: pentapeptide repeat-containing protein [Rhizomicrobium sp.]|nr:pentapeptide repeat-containing protein [Rhizomicrobium sp.]
MAATVAHDGVKGARAFSPEELADVLRDHATYMSHLQGGKRANLRFADLRLAKLAHRELSDADLSGINLQGADLSYAEFISADIQCSDIRHVQARCSNFSHADMRGTILNGSNFNRAKLDYTDLRPGRLLKMNPSGVVKEVLERCGSAEHTDFSECSLFGASFEGAKLQGASFRGAIIHATRFKNAVLTGTDFEGTLLSYVVLDDLHLSEAVLKTCILAPPTGDPAAARVRLTRLLQEHQRWIESDSRAGHCAVLDGEDLRSLGQSLSGFKLTAVSARRCIAVAASFAGAELQGANFEEADLRGANFEGADLRGVRLRGAKLSHARFRNANIGSLLLRSGERLDFDIFRAEINEDQLSEVRGANTTLHG